jgi:MarR family transcriptional regulator, organic hydroperoxide resistance regulator
VNNNDFIIRYLINVKEGEMKNIDNDSLGFLLVQIIRLHHSKTHNLFASVGLHRGQHPILFMLWDKDGRTQKELAEGLQLTPATITDVLQRMERIGLLERRSDPEDLRVSRVYLADKGKQLQCQVEDIFKDLEKGCFKGFTFEEKILLRRFFIQIRNNLIYSSNDKEQL